MNCKKCGQEIDTSAKFCPHCGAPVEGSEKKKKAKKPFYKRWWFWLIVVILLLGSCGSDTEAPVEDSPATESVAAELPAETTAAVETEETVADTQETEAPTAEADSANKVTESVETSADLDAAIVLIESVLKDSFENYEIYHENDIITINVWSDGIAIGAVLANAGDETYLAVWDDLIESLKSFCNSICALVDTLQMDDVVVVVNVLNEENLENVLLSVTEGVVLYNCVDPQ